MAVQDALLHPISVVVDDFCWDNLLYVGIPTCNNWRWGVLLLNPLNPCEDAGGLSRE